MVKSGTVLQSTSNLGNTFWKPNPPSCPQAPSAFTALRPKLGAPTSGEGRVSYLLCPPRSRRSPRSGRRRTTSAGTAPRRWARSGRPGCRRTWCCCRCRTWAGGTSQRRCPCGRASAARGLRLQTTNGGRLLGLHQLGDSGRPTRHDPVCPGVRATAVSGNEAVLHFLLFLLQ